MQQKNLRQFLRTDSRNPVSYTHLYAAHLKGKMQYDEPDYTGATAFMIGNEGNGLSDETADLADTYIKIPMCGQVESLNAAISASLLMYETNRQRRIRSMSQDRMSNIRKVEE